LLQRYKAGSSLVARVSNYILGQSKAPTTAAETAFQKGLVGTESMIGVQARRMQNKLWTKLIKPALQQSTVTANMPEFFNVAKEKITKTAGELGDRAERLNALKSIMDDYKDIKHATMVSLQDFKKGWASRVPQKYYNGHDITNAYNNVR